MLNRPPREVVHQCECDRAENCRCSAVIFPKYHSALAHRDSSSIAAISKATFTYSCTTSYPSSPRGQWCIILLRILHSSTAPPKPQSSLRSCRPRCPGPEPAHRSVHRPAGPVQTGVGELIGHSGSRRMWLPRQQLNP